LLYEMAKFEYSKPLDTLHISPPPLQMLLNRLEHEKVYRPHVR